MLFSRNTRHGSRLTSLMVSIGLTLVAIGCSQDPASCPSESAKVAELRRILVSHSWKLVTTRDDIKPHFYTFKDDGQLVVVEQRSPTFSVPTFTTYGIVEKGSSNATIVGVPPEITYQDAIVKTYNNDTIVFHDAKFLAKQ